MTQPDEPKRQVNETQIMSIMIMLSLIYATLRPLDLTSGISEGELSRLIITRLMAGGDAMEGR